MARAASLSRREKDLDDEQMEEILEIEEMEEKHPEQIKEMVSLRFLTLTLSHCHTVILSHHSTVTPPHCFKLTRDKFVLKLYCKIVKVFSRRQTGSAPND